MLPIKTSVKGPAPTTTEEDIVDEAISYFKANVLFRNYEVAGPADRTLIYLTLYISQCISRLAEKNVKGKEDAKKQLYALSIENFKIPGDGGWALGGFTKDPKDRAEADLFRQYFTQLRQETGIRLVDSLINDDGTQNKYWFSFQKRKFMLYTDLANPVAADEAHMHKLKRLVQSPNSFFMDVKCPGCYQITTVFSHASTVVLCGQCSTVLCTPTGGKARLTEGCSFRRKVD